MPLVVRAWYALIPPCTASTPPYVPPTLEEGYIPRPSFSAAVRDKSIESFSLDASLRRSGLIFTLLFDIDEGDGGVYAFSYVIGGVIF